MRVFDKLREKVVFNSKESMLLDENADLKQRIMRLESAIAEKDKQLSEEMEKSIKSKKLVRKQSEADLLLNALKSVGIIPPDKQTDFFKQDDIFRKRMAYYNAIGERANSGLGLGGILGTGF